MSTYHHLLVQAMPMVVWLLHCVNQLVFFETPNNNTNVRAALSIFYQNTISLLAFYAKRADSH